MLTSVTRLRVRSLRFLPMFLWTTFQSQRQVVRSAGFRGGKLLVDARHTYWTLTTRDDERAMKQFRGSGAHARVMKKLPHWCDEAAYGHWIPSAEYCPIGRRHTRDWWLKDGCRASIIHQPTILPDSSRSRASSLLSGRI